jgi:hypothetical protein
MALASAPATARAPWEEFTFGRQAALAPAGIDACPADGAAV